MHDLFRRAVRAWNDKDVDVVAASRFPVDGDDVGARLHLAPDEASPQEESVGGSSGGYGERPTRQ